MDVDLGQLRALAAPSPPARSRAPHGTCTSTPVRGEPAAQALEAATGRVLLVRSKPVQVTAVRRGGAPPGPAGRTARRRRRARAGDRRPAEPAPTMPIAVNADSLATWVLPALAPLAPKYCFDLHRTDQEHTGGLLRDGTVMAAITAEAEPVPGCTVVRLGGHALPPDGHARDSSAAGSPTGCSAEALARAPVVVFDRRDDLQHAYLAARRRDRPTAPAGPLRPCLRRLPAGRRGWGWAGAWCPTSSSWARRRGRSWWSWTRTAPSTWS